MGGHARFLRGGEPRKGGGRKLGLERMGLATVGGGHGGLPSAAARLRVPFPQSPLVLVLSPPPLPVHGPSVCHFLKCVNSRHKIIFQSCRGLMTHPGPVNKGLLSGEGTGQLTASLFRSHRRTGAGGHGPGCARDPHSHAEGPRGDRCACGGCWWERGGTGRCEAPTVA